MNETIKGFCCDNTITEPKVFIDLVDGLYRIYVARMKCGYYKQDSRMSYDHFGVALRRAYFIQDCIQDDDEVIVIDRETSSEVRFLTIDDWRHCFIKLPSHKDEKYKTLRSTFTWKEVI